MLKIFIGYDPACKQDEDYTMSVAFKRPDGYIEYPEMSEEQRKSIEKKCDEMNEKFEHYLGLGKDPDSPCGLGVVKLKTPRCGPGKIV